MNFYKLPQRIDTALLLKQVEDQPFLWNKNPCRLSAVSPHRETQDMFLRYRDETEFRESGDWSAFSAPHFDDWNQTIDYLPEARKIIMGLMAGLGGEVLGGCFLYKVPPGKQIYQHVDKGWHPEFYSKFNVCLASNPEAAFCYKEDQMVQEVGDVHFFRNDVLHWVVNKGNTDHIVLTVCMRLDSGFRAPWSPADWFPLKGE